MRETAVVEPWVVTVWFGGEGGGGGVGWWLVLLLLVLPLLVLLLLLVPRGVGVVVVGGVAWADLAPSRGAPSLQDSSTKSLL
jgi:hypothetical protein